MYMDDLSVRDYTLYDVSYLTLPCLLYISELGSVLLTLLDSQSAFPFLIFVFDSKKLLENFLASL